MASLATTSYSLAPHRLLDLGSHAEGQLAMLAEDSTGWILISDLDYQLLKQAFRFGELTSQQVDPKSLEVILKLKQAGLITTTEDSNPKEVVKSFKCGSPPRTLEVKLTGSCNYSCEYCYDFSDNRFKQQLDPKRALDIIFYFLNAGQDRLKILFHGGEPLMRFNDLKYIVECVNALVASKQHVSVSYSIQTNGSYLTSDIIDFLCQQNFSVGISCDGLEESANSLRTSRNRSSTLGPIHTLFERYPDFVHQRVGFLAVVTKQSLNYIPSYIQDLQAKRVRTFSFIYMDQEGAGKNLSAQAPSCDEGLQLFKRILSLIEEKRIWAIAIEPVLSRLTNLFSLTPKDYCCKGPCGAASEFMVLDPDGGLRTCDCSDNKYFHIGDSSLQPKDLLTKAHSAQQQIVERHNYLKESGSECKSCSLFGLCGGTCVSKVIIKTSNPKNVDPIECAIAKYFYPYILQQYSLHKEHAPLFEYFFEHYPEYAPSRMESLLLKA